MFKLSCGMRSSMVNFIPKNFKDGTRPQLESCLEGSNECSRSNNTYKYYPTY